MQEPQPQPQIAGALPARRSLWAEAPGWRRMVAAAGLLSVAATTALYLGEREAASSSPPQDLRVSRAPAVQRPTAALPPISPEARSGPAAGPARTFRLEPPPTAAAHNDRIAVARPADGSAREVAELRAEPQPSANAVPAPAASASPQACRLSLGDVPVNTSLGSVIGLEDRQVSLARIPTAEATFGGKIDPGFISEPRVVVRLGSSSEVFVAPARLHVHIGDRVRTQGPYRSPSASCAYVPPLVIGDFGPAPAASPAPQTAPAADGPQSAPTSPEASADSCPITLPYTSRTSASGVVAALVPASAALSAIARDEGRVHGRLDPGDVDLARVLVDVGGRRPIVAVPRGMSVKVGDRVALQDGHRSRAVPCGWTPNMIIDDFGPSPESSTPQAP